MQIPAMNASTIIRVEPSVTRPILAIKGAESSNITIMGNPLTTDLRLAGLTGAKGMVVIYDATGRIMQQASIEGVTGILSISCHSLPAGQYFARIIQNNASQTLPFIKLQ